MSLAIKIATDPMAVVIYQRRDAQGRQQLEVRTGKGQVVRTFRHVRNLAHWIKGRRYNWYEYGSLPASARKALDNWRAGYDKEQAPEQPAPPKLGEVFPQLSGLKEILNG